uniref:Uncharacterized protein n=1 Tax=Cacopsylla melanoneura TaxID=428564 RepID=A0A8D8SX51_9HEMI
MDTKELLWHFQFTTVRNFNYGRYNTLSIRLLSNVRNFSYGRYNTYRYFGIKILDYFQMYVILVMDDTIPIEILDNSFRDISGSSIRKFTKFGLEKIPEYRNYKDIRYRIAKNIEYRFFFLLYHP